MHSWRSAHLQNSANKSGHEVVLEIAASDVLVVFPILI